MHTKRFAMVLITLLLFSVAAFGQEEKKNFVGVKGGISIPQLSGGDDNILSRDFKSRVAPNFGAFVEIGVTEKFSVQPEVNFAGQGGKRTGVQPITQAPPGLPPLPPGAFFFGDFENTAELNYLEVPVLAKYKFSAEEDKPRVYVNGGMFYGRLLTAKTKTSGSSTIFLDEGGQMPLLLPPAGTPLPPIDFTANTDIKNDVNKNNFGITGGGGIEFPFGKNYLVIDARVSRGLRSIQRDTLANGNSKTGNLVISVGYAFGLE
ncbi:MAG: PorT family protein [Pyrinomonadaceae bacterium]|nr:PorT family protein [Pyrinomonadaceae bacterium]